jgi:hypothetical protein
LDSVPIEIACCDQEVVWILLSESLTGQIGFWASPPPGQFLSRAESRKGSENE